MAVEVRTAEGAEGRVGAARVQAVPVVGLAAVADTARAFSLLVYTEQLLPTWLFLKKSRTSRRLTVHSETY